MVHVTGVCDDIMANCLFGNMQYGYHLKAFFEYFHMALVTGSCSRINCLF
jgi:hypothetical protein